MKKPIAIVDLFSGPGGLGEGFSACRDGNGERAYEIGISIEKEKSAHRTLRLRAFLRKFPDFPPEYHEWINMRTAEPDWSCLYPAEWSSAEAEAQCRELGTRATSKFLKDRLASIRAEHGDRTILIGGPPCQAYSLVGRARNTGNTNYRPALDSRNFLYEEYVRVLSALRPAAFVMENVKGILSASVEGSAIFEQVVADFRLAGYRLSALARPQGTLSLDDPRPRDFVVRTEDYGVPQARHRVIILGIRDDIAKSLPEKVYPYLPRASEVVSLSQVLGGMPEVRSGLSRKDSEGAWRDAMAVALDEVRAAAAHITKSQRRAFQVEVERARDALPAVTSKGRIGDGRPGVPNSCPPVLRDWLVDPRIRNLPQNETRGHMPSDLARYLFAACYGKVFDVSPKAADFPPSLAPKHKNWESGKFADRFRVQIGTRPATTITSHISKDGHYFIHPDPSQCRSLTVREAARLQTFPDNYVFLGNRTEQFVQVGNAVPPFLAYQIAQCLLPALERVG